MKLGGITWWRNNYGSILQAYALQKYLREILEQDYVIINQYSKKMASVSNLISKLKEYGLMTTLKRLIGRFGLPKLRKRVQNLQSFVDKNLITTEDVFSEETIAETNKTFDGFICGSDQIWNPANASLDSMYWLKFTQQGKLKISYAPSLGIEEADEATKKKIKDNLQDFDAISSREESGSVLINKIMKRDVCCTVLDPTFLVEKELWDKISEKRIYEEKYIFAYMLKGSKKERQLIERFAKNQGLPIVTIPFLDGEHLVPYDMRFGEVKLWEADPSDFISAIRNAEYVFTDSFHCMVFSCFYHRTFYMFKKKGKLQMNRILGLFNLLGIGDRIIEENMSNAEINAKEVICWDKVDSNINKYRIVSRAYLSTAVERGSMKCY